MPAHVPGHFLDAAPLGLVLVPLLAAAVLFLSQRAKAAILVSVVSAILLSSAGLALHVLAVGPMRHRAGAWEAPLGIGLRADGLSALMLIVTALTGAVVSVYGAGWFRREARRAEGRFFWPLWLFLWAALNALYLSADLFNLYVALELIGLASVALVALSGGAEALIAGMRYLLVSLLGSLSYLLGVALLYGAHGVLDIQALGALTSPGALDWAAMTLMAVGLLAKAALFPLHFWLPSAHASAPAPVSAILSGLVVKAPFYLLLRLWFTAFPGLPSEATGQLLGVLGACAVLWGSLHALLQPRLKMLIAYSTVAQVGYLFFLFPLVTSASPAAGALAVDASLCQLASHAFAKAAMFLAAGNVMLAVGSDRIEDMGGVVRHLPLTFFAFGLAGVSIMGLPLSGGYVAKWLLLNASLESGQWGWAAVAIAGSLMAAGYVFRIWMHGFGQPQPCAELLPVPRGIQLSALALSLLALAMGISSEPLIRVLHAGGAFG
ncbi:MAG: Na(+)/H(+) antiporter subunit D [Syntrophaceae bacterium PtaB.Bin038]|nr:MAG: Na(+)/H(+) antiporter subunit D [Syntrophaceae bacterium PtaB.Bin038]